MFGSMFKGIFGDKNEEAPRVLEKIDQLKIGDMLDMSDSFGLPKSIREQSFEVKSIDSYYYDERPETEWELLSADKKPVFVSMDSEDNDTEACFSLQLKRKDVEAILGWDRLVSVLDAAEGADIELKPSEQYDGWLADTYHCVEFNNRASYLDGDHRGKNTAPGNREEFRYSKFVSQDETKSFEIERWSKNEIDVFVAVLRPVSDIKDFWPKS
ncbi:hypothetical protein MNBD_GAMMA11-932 [hydrothermal vent metagenome]|uniref:DUF4178 domain-containing protein n=1 Tax=hydrothermal vent metagenome TaxID=652676 RepID=A0A3B0XCL2_9ZZZZ